MDFVVRLAFLYGGLFGAIGIQLPFLPLWLAAKGLDEQNIGLVLAAATASRVLIVPFGTRAADRFGTLKGAIVVATLCCAFSLTSIGFASGVAAIALLYALASAAGGTALPLTEAYALQGLTARKRSYGPVRLWGSAAFILGAGATGLLTGWLDPVHIIWVLVTAYWLGVVAALLLVPVNDASEERAAKPRLRLLLGQPALMAVMVASALTQASHALLYGFGTLQWSAAGFGGTTVATLWSVGVIAEILLFAASARFPPQLGSLALIGLGAAGAAARWLAMAFAPGLELLLALQCLHALSFTATHLGAVQFVARAAPPGLAASAQGLLATGNGCAMAAAMAASGMLYANFGLAAYAAMAVLAAVGGLVLLVAIRTRARKNRPNAGVA